jgi:hypothetical protein
VRDEPESTESTTADALEDVTAAIVEVQPGVAAVFGEVPTGLGLDPIDLDLIDIGLVPASERAEVANYLSMVGNAATVGGNLSAALASVQGLYKISDATRALLANGGALAVKDGANLGTVFMNGHVAAQARFIPVTGVNVAQTAAAVGPALAMIALQMTLNEVSTLVATNLALTSQVLTTVRHEQWAELTGLVTTIDNAVSRARELQAVTASEWDKIADKDTDLRKQRELYRKNVKAHVTQIESLGSHARREYLDTNAKAIVFDTHALLSALKAWAGYQALHAARARALGAHDPAEARLADVISRETYDEFNEALAETGSLVAALTRELRILSEQQGPTRMAITKAQKDARAVRATSAQLLSVIEPLADALHPARTPLTIPAVVAAPETIDIDPYLRILRWSLDEDENLRTIAFPYERGPLDEVKAVGQKIGSKVAGLDTETWSTFVAVTDQRVLIAKPSTFLHEASVATAVPLDEIRYVRASTRRGDGRSTIDLITRDENISWSFDPAIDDDHVDALAAGLASSMSVPDSERASLIERSPLQLSLETPTPRT